MGLLSATIKLDTAGLDGRLRQMPTRIANARKQAAENIRRGAARRSRIRTGKMRDGWVAEDGPAVSTVSNDVPYVVFNEYGTRFMAPQPMLTPAVEEERAAFQAAVLSAVVDE